MHPDQLTVSLATVRRLVDALQPGDVGATRRWLESEARAARELLGRTRFRTPEPVAVGEPGEGFPLP